MAYSSKDDVLSTEIANLHVQSPRKSRHKRKEGLHFQDRHRSEGRLTDSSSKVHCNSKYIHVNRPDVHSSSDSNYSADFTKLKSSTCKWDVMFLESLGIYYNTHFHALPSDILDIIYRKTGVFGPLLEEQKEYVNQLKESLTYSCSVTEILGVMNMVNIDTIMPDMKKDIDNIRKKIPRVYFASNVEDFIKSTRLMVKYQVAHLTQNNRSYPVPEDMFVDMFKGFVKMCRLLPVPGSAWKASMSIHGKDVKSESDVVIMTENHLEEENEDAISVVSIVEVKNLTLYRDGKQVYTCEEKTRPSRNSSRTPCIQDDQESCDSEPAVHQSPAIYERIGPKVLGQHGGELLIHHGLFGRRLSKGKAFKYLPGMIVVGTEITFTVLVLNGDHVRELEKKYVSEKNKAYIYYSEPRDLLKKEDRDVLLESFARLNNINQI